MASEERLGIVVYGCPAHGTWLFKGNLEELLWKFNRTDAVALGRAQRELEEWGRDGWRHTVAGE